MTTEFVEGYNLTQAELALEKGEGANPAEVNQQADLITQNWQIHEAKPYNPVLLMLGGFQGSGKTTTLEKLVKDLGLLVVSPDEIRHNLFSQKYPFSDNSVKLVNATKFELVNRALKTGQSFAIDQALTPDRVNLVKGILVRNPNWRLLSVFLSAPVDVLVRRVAERPQLPGRYRGTVDELMASMDKYKQRYREPSLGGYDLIVDTVENDLEKVVDLISKRIANS